MVGINCLFNYDGINYRFNINSKNDKDVINFEEFRKTLRDHPKLKEVDFFDTEKYVVEIFDKGFDDYVKLPRDADICDYSKLRARLRPKSNLSLAKKAEESRKRPLTMYAEINMEEEHASKVLRGSPPPTAPSSTPRMRASSPLSSSFRRSHSGITEQSRTDHLSRSHTSAKILAPSKPSSTPSFKPKVIPKPSPAARNQPPPPPTVVKTPVPPPVKTPIVTKTPDIPPNPFSSSNSSPNISSKISNNSTTPKTSSFHGNGANSIPPGVDQDSYLLAKSVEKYNDEFTNIMMFDEIWETDHVWPFVFREVSGHGVKSITNVKDARSAFKSLVDKYIETLQKTNLTTAAANALWPLFDIFHSKLNMKPFYGRIQTLKDAFNNATKDSGEKLLSSTSPPTSALSQPPPPPPSQQMTAAIASSPQQQQQQQQPEETPKPQRIQTKAPSEDIILLSNSGDGDDLDKSDVRMEEDDDIQEVHPNTSPPRKQLTPPISCASPKTSPPATVPEASQPIVVTSDDFRLLLAVEDHNKEFYDDIVPEFSVWRDVTDQINLFKPFEPSLVARYKTRFYELLREFIRIEKSSMPMNEKAQWKLYSSFINIDITPFLSKV